MTQASTTRYSKTAPVKILCAIGALTFATPTLAGGHGQGLGGVSDAIGGAVGGGGGGGGISANVGIGGGGGVDVNVGIGGGSGSGTGGGTTGEIDVAIGGGSPGGAVGDPIGTADTVAGTVTSKTEDAAKRAKAGVVRLADLVGYRVVDNRGQQLGLIQNVNQGSGGMYAIQVALVSSMPRDQAVLRFNNLRVSSDEVRVPISKRALRNSLQ